MPTKHLRLAFRGINRVGVNFHRMLDGALDEILALFGQFCNPACRSTLVTDGTWVGTHNLVDPLALRFLNLHLRLPGPMGDNDFSQFLCDLCHHRR